MRRVAVPLFLVVSVVTAMALLPAGCSGDEDIGPACTVCTGAGGNTAQGGDGGLGFAGSGGEGGSPTVCDEQQIELELAGVRVQLLLDFSSSMYLNNKWLAAALAVQTMMNNPANADTWFGLDTFPKPEGGLTFCNTDGDAPVPLGPGQHGAIVQWMQTHLPNLLAINTPLVSAIEYYMRTPSSPLHSDDTANYLVVISDGQDNCYFGEGIFTGQDKRNVLAGVVHDLKDVAGIKTIAIGFGIDASAEAELNTIARHGGSTFDSYIQATNQAELEAALLEISQAIRPCRYKLDSPDASADPSKVNIYFDGTLIPRDLTETDGWNWTQSDELEVEFFGSACDDIKADAVTDVTATFGCPTKIGPDQDVCAERDFFLRFPDVAVMFLQDLSGSMSDDNKWTDATIAITEMLTDDRNNQVEFGLDVFPDLGLSDPCITEPYANVPVGKYNTFMIIDWISNHEPLGDTPLLSAFERFSYSPGRIGEDGVSGSLVVISDGTDTCAPGSVDVPAALAAATTEVVDQFDAKVFAIGFGSGVNPDELNAIAANGNTGLSQYSQADDLVQLEQVFDMIASMITSCVFEVPYAGSDVDYAEVNFYLDGQIVPRDTNHVDGWDWINPVTMTEVEFFGTWCDMLKSGQITDVLVEFGCETIVPR